MTETYNPEEILVAEKDKVENELKEYLETYELRDLARKYKTEIEFLIRVGRFSSRDEKSAKLPMTDYRNWSNVLGHDLVVTVAAEVLCTALKLSPCEVFKIFHAAILHDWYKRVVKNARNLNCLVDLPGVMPTTMR